MTTRLAVPRTRPPAWWGMVVLIMTEATVFATLLSANFFLRATSREWPQGGIEAPHVGARIIVFTVALLASSAPLVIAERAVGDGRTRTARVALAASFVLGLAFLVNQVLEYRDLPFAFRDNAYASSFYAVTGLHGLHVAMGLAMSAVVQLKVALGKVDERRHLTLDVFALYWHFVDVVWIFVFASLYVSVRFG
ncbi:MAG: heme-copper oxidase subunit III [Actinobacteria bacterium]|nr:heme-copper oxidase subunit III [Actinomycetota bacterium]